MKSNFLISVITLFVILTSTISSNSQNFNGYALYNKQGSNSVYLIDENSNIAHSWNCSEEANYAVLLKSNGNIMRGTKYNNNQLNGAAVGGMVQELDANANVVWDYVYSNSDHCSHHDITLIGDNVLLTAWEVKSSSELNAAGYDNANSDKWATHFVEIAPDGFGGGQIVWEWHIWDHMIQDTDQNKPSYGVISDHPELIDINMISSSGPGGGDWFHVNGVNYNEELDQIAFSSRFASEIYIIDHSTTTSDAATHSGGNSGMGGDILYRWGNPSNYDMSGTQVIPAAVHDVRWIKNDGRPNGGYLQVFNNEGAGNSQSTIDAIETPLDPNTGYTYLRTAGQPFGPSSYSWRYDCPYDAPGQSASNRMTNGNVFVNTSGGQGGAGIMYEADSTGQIVWTYNAGGTEKAFRYECEDPGIINLLNNPCNVSWDCVNNTCVDPGDGTGTYAFLSDCNSACLIQDSWNCINNTCVDPGDGSGTYSSLSECNMICNTTSINQLPINTILTYPNPFQDILNIEFELSSNQDISIILYNMLGQVIYQDVKKQLTGFYKHEINTQSFVNGIYLVDIKSSKDGSFIQRTHLIR